jgi:hypothetical protein
MARGSGGVSFPVARCGFDPRRRADKDLRNLELNYGKDWHSTWTGLLMRRLPTWGYNTMAVGSSRKRASKMPLS